MPTGIAPVPGLPRVGTAKEAQHRLIFREYSHNYLPGGKIIAGADARDPGNTGDVDQLRAGLLMGKITASGKYAPSIIGVSTGAIAAAATTINVSAATAAEIVRRIGTTGTLRFIGPPTANGTVATFTETYSAVNTGTGDITISAADAALVAGSFVADNDGTYLPVAPIPDGFPLKVTDNDGTDLDVPFPLLPVSGVIISANLLPVWPSDTSLQQWLVDQLERNGYGKWVFDYKY